MIYDVIVLGGGPGGYMAAEKAGEAGLKTLLIEKAQVGGTCLHEGCIPTKTLLYCGKIYDHCASNGRLFGVSCEASGIDLKKVADRKKNVIKTLTKGVQFQLQKKGVETKFAQGTVIGKLEFGFQVSAAGEQYDCKNLIIATGSEPIIPNIDGLQDSMEEGFVLTSKEILDETNRIGMLAIIGGGVIGLEFASYFNSIGTKVTVVEVADTIGGSVDKQIAQELKKEYERLGVKFVLGAQVTGVEEGGVSYSRNGAEHFSECDRVLVCVGRRANAEGLGLEQLGAVIERGALITDDSCCTNVPGLYAVGDVNGKSMLAHTAYREADCVINQILGQSDLVDYFSIPSVIYTNPEVAVVGINEDVANSMGFKDVETIMLPMSYSGRFVAESTSMSGLCKIVFDRESRTMIGAQCMAGYASEFIAVCALLIMMKTPIEQMRKIVFPHPTACEILREAIHAVKL